MTSGRGDGHRESLRGLGVSGPPLEGLTAYLDRLAAWSHRVNLTGARTPAARVALLVAPVLPMVDRLEPGRLLDVGSGNGSPGLVLAILEPDRPVTLLEPRQRRWGFLLEAARAALRPVEVLRVRHDAYAGPRARNVTLRALALPLAEMAPLVEVGGQVLTLGGAAREGGPFRTEGADELPGGLILRRYRRTP